MTSGSSHNSLDELENGETHDELWNAAQREMVVTGEMHNYVRMLWGKNVIAWSPTYEIAFETLSISITNTASMDATRIHMRVSSGASEARPAMDGAARVRNRPLYDEWQHRQEIRFEEIISGGHTPCRVTRLRVNYCSRLKA
jgi:hypothetical protein